MKAIILFVSFFCQFASASALKKQDVLELLKLNGNRWRQTEGQMRDAEAKLDQASAALSPFVSFSARQMVAKINPVQYGVTSQTELNWIGVGSVGLQGGIALWDSASKARIEAAKANLSMQTANEKYLKNELTFLALLQFLTVQKTKRHQEVITTALVRDQKILAAAKQKFASGFGIGLDVERAEGLVEHQKFKQLEAETAFIKACQDLGSTLGTDEMNCDVEPLTVFPIEKDRLDELAKTNFVDRFDLKASEAAVTAVEALRDEVKNETMPKIIAFGETSFVGSSIPNGLERPLTGLAGVQLSMPIYSGGLHKGRTQEQSVKISMASAQRNQLLIEAKNQLKIATAQLQSARSALGVSQRQIEIATKELGFAEKKRDSGSIGSIEFHTALVNLTNANELNVQVQFGYEAAKLNYCRVIGSPNLCLDEMGRNK